MIANFIFVRSSVGESVPIRAIRLVDSKLVEAINRFVSLFEVPFPRQAASAVASVKPVRLSLASDISTLLPADADLSPQCLVYLGKSGRWLDRRMTTWWLEAGRQGKRLLVEPDARFAFWQSIAVELSSPCNNDAVSFSCYSAFRH